MGFKMADDEDLDSIAESIARAKYELEQGNSVKSASLYRELIDLLPPDGIRARLIHSLLAASAHLEASKFAEAIDDCRCAISLDPSHAKAWRCLGLVLLEAGRLDDAEQALLRSIELSSSASACMYLGSVYFRQEKWSNAEQHYRESVRLDPDFDEAHYNLGLSAHYTPNGDSMKR